VGIAKAHGKLVFRTEQVDFIHHLPSPHLMASVRGTNGWDNSSIADR
jgi:hypothetical protein